VGGMVVVPRNAPGKQKYYNIHTGICSNVRFGAHSNTLQNVQRAVAERVLFVPGKTGGLQLPPRPQSKSYLFNLMQPMHNQFRNRISNDSSFPIPPLSDSDFLKSYSGAKRLRYEQACESLLRESATQKDAKIKSFVKIEKINFSSKVDPAPRIIQPRTFRYSAALGKVIKHLEKPLFKVIADIYGGPTVLKGMDCIGQAKALLDMWEQFDNPVAIGLDASRFDQHCSVEMLKWEQKIWQMMTTSKRQLKRLMRWQLYNDGTAYVQDGKVKYKTNGSRMSGDMNTSSGNCMIMCSMVYVFCLQLGISKFRLANNGDDCILIVEDKLLQLIVTNLDAFFTRCGYTMKMDKPVYEFEQISFCQTQPVWDGLQYRMVRDPRVAMAKDLCCLLNITDNWKTKAVWYNAMSHGGSALTGGIPCWQSFYTMFPRCDLEVGKNDTTLKGFESSGFYRMIPKIDQSNMPISDRSRYSFWLAFGILPDTQKLLEDRFNNMSLSNMSRNDSKDYAEMSILVENLPLSR
jgi:hypothetical protein